MAFPCILLWLSLVIAPAVAYDPARVVRRVAVEANGRVSGQKSQLGVPFWRALRQELEAKKKTLASSNANRSMRLSAGTQRELLWHAVQETDLKFHGKCKIDEGIVYAGEPTFTLHQAASSRECALLCAAVTLVSSHMSACKKFTFNRTAKECKFFGSAHQEHRVWADDACCSSGPPCHSMFESIQNLFELEKARLEHFAVNQNSTQRLSPDLPQSQLQISEALALQTKSPAAKHSRHRISDGRASQPMSSWYRWLVAGFVAGPFLAVAVWLFRYRLVASKSLNNQAMHSQLRNDQFIVAGRAADY